MFETLKKYWGYDSFRPMQAEIIGEVLAVHDVLAILPTGGGKSVCFQVPALMRDGLCLVVSPLIALMKDQVQNLRKRGISALAVHAGMTWREIDIALDNAIYGDYKFLYVSPERLRTDLFKSRVARMNINSLVVDEAHCISQWGYDFRPDYLQIAEIRKIIGQQIPVVALTATATPAVADDIMDKLQFRRQNKLVGDFARPNLSYVFRETENKMGQLLRVCEGVSGSGIVYVSRRKYAEDLATFLQQHGVGAEGYHAGLNRDERSRIQDAWKTGETRVIVSTNAFGMGIDKPDVRMVIHMDLPDSLEAYFQEAGRAGRDLKPSEAFLLVAESDIKQLKDNLQQSYPELERIKTIYDALGNYLQIPVGAGNGQSYPFDMNEFANSYGFSLLEVFNSLKLMEREGFFALSEAMESPSQLFIKASREDLYRFQVEYAEFDAMIKYLLRNYPGILSDFVKIKEEQISHKMGIDVTQVEQTLKNLEKYNFLTYIQRNGKPQIQYLTERQDTRHFALSDEVYKDRKDDATRRVQAVIDFVNNDSECRSVQLLRYFGEKIKTRCGRCDVCSIRNQMKINDEEYKNISELILDELKKRVVPLYETPSLAKNYLEEKVLETVRWMLDNGIIEQDENGNLKEKGRQWSLF